MVLGPVAETKGPRLSGRNPTNTIIQMNIDEIASPLEKARRVFHALSPSPQLSPWQGEGALKEFAEK